MSKINRCDSKERYNITVPWLVQFAQGLEKEAHGIDYLQQLFQQNKAYGSIEEKMADIRERIGFDLINKVSEELDKSEKRASAHECACGGNCKCGVKNASYQHPEGDVKKMENILSYIRDMTEAEPHLDSATVVSRCREEEGLKFGDIRINMEKLKEHIEQMLEKHQDGGEAEVVVYIPQEPISMGEVDDDVADYYRRQEHS